MRKLIFIIILILTFSSCKSSKRAKIKNETTTIVNSKDKPESRTTISKSTRIKSNKSDDIEDNIVSPKSRAQAIIDYAKQFEGVRYKWAGATKEGMDCSGLVFESFRAFDILLPRISRDIAKLGEEIDLKNAIEGDLVFFRTSNRRNSINHVGLIISTEDNTIKFIHSTASAGVIISAITETYWDKAFVEARRVL